MNSKMSERNTGLIENIKDIIDFRQIKSDLTPSSVIPAWG